MNILKIGLTLLSFAAFSIEALSGTLFTKRIDEVWAYDTDTGNSIDHFSVMTNSNGGIAASADRLFISNGQHLIAYSHDGNLLYSMDGYSNYASGVAYGDGKVFSTDGYNIFAIDAQSGMFLDAFSSRRGMLHYSSFDYNDGKLFTRNALNEVWVYDTDNGSVIDHFPVTSSVNDGGMAASADRLFIGDGHDLIAYSHDGNLLYPMGGYYSSYDASGIAYGDGKVFSTDGDIIFAIDAQSGMMLDSFYSIDGMLEESSFAYVPSASEVPVPAAAWLFGSALLGLGFVRKK